MKFDVSLSLFGKPYNTIVTLQTFLRHSSQHIDKIYINVEKKQPHEQFNTHLYIQNEFPDVKIEYHFPDFFYTNQILKKEDVLSNQTLRMSLPYQYALENTDKKYLFVMHNDIIYHDDILGKLKNIIETDTTEYAGIGQIGQCWNCPASFENKCSGSTYQDFIPSKEEALNLISRHEIPRREITERLIKSGMVHPLPECRLSEYSSVINVPLYNQNAVPKGDTVLYAAQWGGCDWGTVWFYEMVNKGFKFKHLTLEDYGTHAPFNPNNDGTTANTRKGIYDLSEKLALEYIEQHLEMKPLTIATKVKMLLNTFKCKLKIKVLKLLYGSK